MKVEFSKDFEKSVRKLSGKILASVRAVIQEVIDANSIEEISDCKKLADYNFVYRIRIGNYRAFFVFHVQIEENVAIFQYLISRGEAYNKKNTKKLKDKDK